LACVRNEQQLTSVEAFALALVEASSRLTAESLPVSADGVRDHGTLEAQLDDAGAASS
jgi:hypothetical protein